MDEISANRVTNGNQGTESRYLMIDLLPVAVLAIGEYISLMSGVTIAAEGLRKLGLKPKSIIYSLDTHILVAKIFVYLVCSILAMMVNSVVRFPSMGKPRSI